MGKLVLIVSLVVSWTCAANVRQVSADVILPNLPSGSEYELVFVTSGGTSSTSSNIDDYNTFVTQQAALSSSLPTGLTWRAVGSTATVNAIDNAPTWDNIPIYNTYGQLIADGQTDLWDGSIQNPIMYDQDGSLQPHIPVWSGTLADGTAIPGGALGQWTPWGGAPRRIHSTGIWSGLVPGLGLDSAQRWDVLRLSISLHVSHVRPFLSYHRWPPYRHFPRTLHASSS